MLPLLASQREAAVEERGFSRASRATNGGPPGPAPCKFTTGSQRYRESHATRAEGARLSLDVPEISATPAASLRWPRFRKEHLLSRRFLLLALRWLAIGVAALWLLAALTLVALRWIDPPTTAVHMERRLQALFSGTPYREHYEFIPLTRISLNLQHAVIAAEDARFYQHHGFDWHAMQLAADADMEGGRLRGGSTLTQQLVKNLFFGTGRSILRKGAEAASSPSLNSSSASAAFWSFTSTSSNGVPESMAQRRPPMPGIAPAPPTSTRIRRRASPRSCPLP